MAISLFSRKQTKRSGGPNGAGGADHGGKFEHADTLTLDPDELRRLVQLGQYGVVVRNAERFNHQAHFTEAKKVSAQAIDEQFALVPEGYVVMPQSINDTPGCPEITEDTAPFLLQRCAITNSQFQHFLDAGGYEELDYWPEDIWPHLIDFKDQTDQPGPRYWRDSRHNRKLAKHPVVGVSSYEAEAFAQWAGYRLPRETEWQMAASWRIRSSADVLRRYPWGDALDVKRCNIWASGIGGTSPVDSHESGAAPNGVHHLIGNVWEWNSSDFDIADDEGRPIVGGMLMKSIRGGAYDTYFPAQATSTFRSGMSTLSRFHNVGFRCALDLDCLDC